MLTLVRRALSTHPFHSAEVLPNGACKEDPLHAPSGFGVVDRCVLAFSVVRGALAANCRPPGPGCKFLSPSHAVRLRADRLIDRKHPACMPPLFASPYG